MRLMRHAVSSVAHLHSNGVVHRDIKPENLVLASAESESSLKLIDFGAAALVEQGGSVAGKAGTWTYWSPEQVKGLPHDQAVDMWALGVVLYILLSGRHPFETVSSSQGQVLDSILSASFTCDTPEWTGVSNGAREVVRGLLESDPRRRLTAQQMLSHPWIRGVDVPEEPLAWWASTVPLYRRLSFWRFGKVPPPRGSTTATPPSPARASA